MSLETGEIDEATFDERERDLLDRLDELEAQQAESESDEEDTPETDDRNDEADENDDDADMYLLHFRTGNLSGGVVLHGITTDGNQEDQRKPQRTRADLRDDGTDSKDEERSCEPHECAERGRVNWATTRRSEPSR